ncbi:MAG TPA: aminotransferase class I/II-fold pyridoxal phosphate-dependent enzyme [Kofleriaceae bacterium]|nr:aminotransferase class I/II-fold pyridoxal phosphate-dependent enzyme [Kofleriaceae bacterium]
MASSPLPDSIATAYDPERFRQSGHELIDAMADALARWQRREGVVLPWRTPDDALAMWSRKGFGGTDLVVQLRRIMASSTALYHPRCMAHQVPPPLPGAALAELVSALLNNGMAVYEMGPAAVPIELSVVDWMCQKLGYAEGAGGVLTSGGSLGNLTALLAMRQAAAGFDVWSQGAHAGPPLAVVTSTDAHYSVARTLRVMGWGDGGVIAVPVDDKHRLTASAVFRTLESVRDRKVIGIIAAAGSTATGAFDPLEELAEVAQRHRLWLHVDAAHGGGVALSQAHRHKLAGIERADSVVWDAHKMMMMPALVTAVLFKRGSHVYDAFAQQASYLFAQQAREETWWDLGQRTLECTKRMMAIEVWAALRVHGEGFFNDVVDHLIALAAQLAAKVRAAGDFELAIEPELNIVCYRHRPEGVAPGPVLDEHNRKLRQRLVEDGRFYIVGTQLPGGYFLRSTIMNPLIEPADFDDLLAHLRTLCRP